MSLRALQGPTGGGTPVGGSGTTNTIPRWTGPSTLGDSVITDNGTVIGVANGARTLLFNLVQVSGNQVNTPGAGELAIQYATSKNTVIYNGSSPALFVNGTSGYVGIGTASPTAGRALTTVADLDVYGVRVGRGAGAVSTNTAIGASALNANTSGTNNTAMGVQAANLLTTGAGNTAYGFQAGFGTTIGNYNTYIGANIATGSTSGGSNNTATGYGALAAIVGGNNNTAAGYQAGTAITSGSSNVLLGWGAGNTLTTGNQNICIGVGAITAAAGDNNQLVVGSVGNYVATNGGATTYYATAGASLGYIQVRLNGANVKIQVFAP